MTADSESPLEEICSEFPQKADRLRILSGVLNRESGSELWLKGGIDTVKGLKYIEQIVWQCSDSVEAK